MLEAQLEAKDRPEAVDANGRDSGEKKERKEKRSSHRDEKDRKHRHRRRVESAVRVRARVSVSALPSAQGSQQAWGKHELHDPLQGDVMVAVQMRSSRHGGCFCMLQKRSLRRHASSH